MLSNCKIVLEEGGGHIAINPVFDKLITSLGIAVDIVGKMDKESTSYNDIFTSSAYGTLRDISRHFNGFSSLLHIISGFSR
jgi:hypothetical protein